jgi:protein-tyrosine phosphatase
VLKKPSLKKKANEGFLCGTIPPGMSLITEILMMTNAAPRLSVLFVCMGNICRSPTAEGVFRKLIDGAGLAHAVGVDSAGTHAYHLGEAPDQRASETALRRGVDLKSLRARRVEVADFERFDHILAMDADNYQALRELCPLGTEEKIKLFMDFSPKAGLREVPDPYYGGPRGFEHVFDLIEAAAQGLLVDITRQLRAPRQDAPK